MTFGTRTLIATGMVENEIKALMGHVSNESEDVSGRTSAEIERVLYVRVQSFDFLERATGAERQEQWSIKIPKTDENAGSGSIRVRKCTNLREPGAAVQYVLTSKLDIGSKGSSAETPEQSTVDQFNIFKYLANKGMLKDRYSFPIDGTDLIWEVDCFPKPGELYSEWVKVDLEKWPANKELPQLPMNFSEMIDGSEASQTPESKEKISRMYQDIFLIANTKEPLSTYIQGGEDQPGVAKDDQTNQPAPGADDGQNNPNPDDASGSADDAANGDGGSNDDADGDAKGKGQGGAENDQGAAGKTSEGGDDSSADAAGSDSGSGEE